MAPNGGCLPPGIGGCVDEAYTDGGRAGYPCVLPGTGNRCGVLPNIPGFCGGRVARSAKGKHTMFYIFGPYT